MSLYASPEPSSLVVAALTSDLVYFRATVAVNDLGYRPCDRSYHVTHMKVLYDLGQTFWLSPRRFLRVSR